MRNNNAYSQEAPSHHYSTQQQSSQPYAQQHQYHAQQRQSTQPYYAQQQQRHSGQPLQHEQQQGFKFVDISRGIVNAGKKKEEGKKRTDIVLETS
jgi:hypothetical protein